MKNTKIVVSVEKFFSGGHFQTYFTQTWINTTKGTFRHLSGLWKTYFKNPGTFEKKMRIIYKSMAAYKPFRSGHNNYNFHIRQHIQCMLAIIQVVCTWRQIPVFLKWKFNRKENHSADSAQQILKNLFNRCVNILFIIFPEKQRIWSFIKIDVIFSFR